MNRNRLRYTIKSNKGLRRFFIARDLEYISLDKSALVVSKIDEVMRMIHTLNQKLKVQKALRHTLSSDLRRLTQLKVKKVFLKGRGYKPTTVI